MAGQNEKNATDCEEDSCNNSQSGGIEEIISFTHFEFNRILFLIFSLGFGVGLLFMFAFADIR